METRRRKKRRRKISKQEQKRRKQKELIVRKIKFLTLASIIWCGISLVVASAFYEVSVVRGYGMIPNLRHGEVVLSKKRESLKRFDIVKYQLGNNRSIFLRVIAFPGDDVKYVADDLLINGEQIDEKFIVQEINQATDSGGHYTTDFSLAIFGEFDALPEDNYLLLGDNRLNTSDSRYYGLMTSEKIKGKVVARLFPFSVFKLF